MMKGLQNLPPEQRSVDTYVGSGDMNLVLLVEMSSSRSVLFFPGV